jgi:hypothetical protein
LDAGGQNVEVNADNSAALNAILHRQLTIFGTRRETRYCMTSIGNHQVGHSEIPADNVDNLKNFYSSLFGWQFERGETQGYYMIKNAGISGAITQKDPQQISNQFVTVESIEDQFIRTLSLYSFCRFLC